MAGGGADFLVVGGGIAGAAAAAHLAQHGRVALVEAEDALAYHATGRSAAMLIDSYGPPGVRLLVRASRPFFASPPDGFDSLLERSGLLYVADEATQALLDGHLREVKEAERWTARQACALVPALREEAVAAAAWEPNAERLDVHAAHTGFLRMASGIEILRGARLERLERDGDGWRATAGGREIAAGAVVNAAGAWADEVAALAGARPVGIEPRRRTAALLELPEGAEVWPLVAAMDESVYFRPLSGKLMVSPADETPSPPCDAQPEEIDVAIAIDRLQKLTNLEVPRIAGKWAGLRSFAPDGELVIGEDPEVAGFFWMAGQGGYGIQTSPAAGRALASLAVDGRLPSDMLELGLRGDSLSPARFASGER